MTAGAYRTKSNEMYYYTIRYYTQEIIAFPVSAVRISRCAGQKHRMRSADIIYIIPTIRLRASLHVSMTKDLTILPKLRPTAWNSDCREIVERYFRDPAHELLTIYLHRGALRALVDAYPREATDSGLCYFARREPWQIFRPESFVGQVQFGCLTDRRLDMAILRLTEATFAPLAFKSPAWPDGIRNLCIVRR
ncbi:unnamed protein product [Trichogramma brassicae]|uniref:Uncharacterized protein n=1 Tax=Trichogramma brassicae TaxID=86971 RepID=A0A6H5IZK0_9HYME|nr:unnamed protein product [Trichogramma brassicae]